MWSAVDYIEEENEEGDENLGRDVGLYILIVVGGLVTFAMVLCAYTVNQPHFLQLFAGTAFFLSMVFLGVSGSQVNDIDSSTGQRFLAFGFLIGITLFFGCLSAFRLSKIRDFDPTASTTHPHANPDAKPNAGTPFAIVHQV